MSDTWQSSPAGRNFTNPWGDPDFRMFPDDMWNLENVQDVCFAVQKFKDPDPKQQVLWAFIAAYGDGGFAGLFYSTCSWGQDGFSPPVYDTNQNWGSPGSLTAAYYPGTNDGQLGESMFVTFKDESDLDGPFVHVAISCESRTWTLLNNGLSDSHIPRSPSMCYQPSTDSMHMVYARFGDGQVISAMFNPSNQTWESQGPTGQTTIGGGSWSNDQPLSLWFQADRLFFALSKPGAQQVWFMYTTDNGQTWSSGGPGAPGSTLNLSMDPNYGVTVASDGGIWTSLVVVSPDGSKFLNSQMAEQWWPPIECDLPVQFQSPPRIVICWGWIHLVTFGIHITGGPKWLWAGQ